MSLSLASLHSATTGFTLPAERPISGSAARACLTRPFEGGADAQRVGQRNRSLQLAEFLQLGPADRLAERVDDVEGGGDLLPEHVAAMRQDDGHASPGRTSRRIRRPFVDDRDVPDPDIRDIGDGVVPAGFKDAQPDAQLAGTGPAAG